MEHRQVKISTEFIKLEALLKFEGMAETGGDAKERIQAGEVTVKSFFPKPGGMIELRPANADFKTQIYPESEVAIQGKVLALQRRY